MSYVIDVLLFFACAPIGYFAGRAYARRQRRPPARYRPQIKPIWRDPRGCYLCAGTSDAVMRRVPPCPQCGRTVA